MSGFSDYIGDRSGGDTIGPKSGRPKSFWEDTGGTTQPLGGAPEDPLWSRVARGVTDAANAAVNTATFGGASKLDQYSMGRSDYQQQQADEDLKRRSPYASMIGSGVGMTAPAMGVSKILGAAVPALAGQSALPQVGNAAATSGLLSAGEDISKGELPDWKRTAIAAASGGALGGVGAGIARYAFPRARIGAATSEIGSVDMYQALEEARKAGQAGVKLTAPEALQAVAPGKSGRLAGMYNTYSSSPGGSQEAYNFMADRAAGLSDTINDAVKGMGATATAGVDASKTAGAALQRARDMVYQSAEPLYKAAAGKMVAGTPKDQATIAAMDKVAGDPIVKEALGGSKPNQVGFLRDALERLNTMYDSASTSLRRDAIGSAREKITGLMKQTSGKFADAEDIVKSGHDQLIDPLKAGPLGRIASGSGDPAEALFHVRTPADAQAAINAGKRMDAIRPGTTRGLLVGHLQDAATRSPADFSKALPSEHAQAVADQFGGIGYKNVSDVMDALKKVNPQGTNVQPVSRTPGHGPHGTIWHSMQNMGSKNIVQTLQDPEKTFEGLPWWKDLSRTRAKIGTAGLRGVGAGLGAKIPGLLLGDGQQ